MKRAVVLLAVLLVLDAVQSLDLHFKDEMIECGREMGISPEQIKDMVAKNDDQLGCINACVMKKIGALVDSKLNKDNLMAILEKNKDTLPNYAQLTEGLQGCYDEASSAGNLPECQLAWKFAMCMHQHLEG